ncbi:M4 family metallopeptidase [Streptomyces albidus (ex Kaewkla and Franco 2022)]|uniref:M4 family metallopeptidase n=1 Tax=Streptomyces albidus (ex Kaewkla and Franco 2022) TaxID=722709 RepID=UPI0015EF271D|nr:M4 family metallopeptidase [Streptomyces albidus (ex Kaewkla and Franco 2022)]
MRSFSRKQRISAFAATAALVVAGITAGTATAGPTEQDSGMKAGATAAKLTASQKTSLIKQADSKTAKAADAKALGLGSKENLEVKDVVKNKDGATHVRYARTFDGMPVLGGDMVVHKSKSGKQTGVTKSTKAEIKVSTQGVSAAAKPATPKAEGSKAPRKVVFAMTGKPVLAWETVKGGLQKSGAPSQLHVITDAKSGKKLMQYQGIHEADGTGASMYSGEVKLTTGGSDGKFTLSDETRGGSKTTNLENSESGDGKDFTDEDNKWGTGKADDPQTAAVDAHYGAQQTWDFYKDVFKREGIAGDGKGAPSRVHYGDNYVNAFWDDSCFCMTYGDGEGNKAPLTSLDVAAHEMSHGVTSTTAGLVYAGESGGLNEATSDIFAAATEFHAPENKEDVGDFLVGEEIDINGDGTPLRYMDKPSQDGNSLDEWSANAGDVDVHYSSGIANHWFFLMSMGSGKSELNGVSYDSPTSDGSTIKGIGITKAQEIWFKALTENMTENTDYKAAREATVKASNDLFGADSAETKAVEAAWTAVAVK